jgi:ribosomal protein S27AE
MKVSEKAVAMGLISKETLDEHRKDFYTPFTRTPILCPNCMKKKLMANNGNEGWCDECGEEFYILGEKTVRFK